MRVADVIPALEAIAPLDGAESWDNVGLLVGEPSWPADRILLTIDLTESVLEEAIAAEATMVVAYHPPIFEPMRALTDATPRQRLVLTAARRGIALYSPHTALDSAPDGVNDWLAGGLGDGDVRALEARATLPMSEERKLVTFCPASAVDRIRSALATAGAGHIGAYELCSFEIAGTGTFFGGGGTKPAVGRPGTLERVEEVRLEMVCPAAALGRALIALREFHPYEEPPIEIYALQPRPQRAVGTGRRVVLDRRLALGAIVERIKTRLGVRHLQVAAGRGAQARYGTIGLCAGAGGSLLATALEQGCELYLTGEMRHHDVLDAQSRGATVVLAGHTNTERGYLRPLRKRLRAALPDATVEISRRDRDPLRLV